MKRKGTWILLVVVVAMLISGVVFIDSKKSVGENTGQTISIIADAKKDSGEQAPTLKAEELSQSDVEKIKKNIKDDKIIKALEKKQLTLHRAKYYRILDDK
jgi:hypothetical protein